MLKGCKGKNAISIFPEKPTARDFSCRKKCQLHKSSKTTTIKITNLNSKT
jgi:hypothetical protein